MDEKKIEEMIAEAIRVQVAGAFEVRNVGQRIDDNVRSFIEKHLSTTYNAPSVVSALVTISSKMLPQAVVDMVVEAVPKLLPEIVEKLAEKVFAAERVSVQKVISDRMAKLFARAIDKAAFGE